MDYQTIKNWTFPVVKQTYTEKDSILYALGIGFGQAATAASHLQFTYEKDLQAFPTMAVVLGYPGFWMKDPASGINWVKLVHGEQRLNIHHPIPATGKVVSHAKITHVIDKGADKGALVITERTLEDDAGTLLATISSTTFCRGDGGLSQSDESPTQLKATPDTAPELTCTIPILPQAALIYRLSGDDNPLHADPDVAQAAGYAKPILHGLCTYGVAARAIVQTLCDNDARRLTALHNRFSSPVYPGETLIVEMWRTGPNSASYRAKVAQRDVVVLSHGYAEFK